MNTLDHLYEPHLTIRKFSILPGKEWFPGPSDWSLIQVENGVGYWLHGGANVHLEQGTVIVVWDGRGTTTLGTVYENSYVWILTLSDGKVVDGTAFYDSIAFNQLWETVTP